MCKYLSLSPLSLYIYMVLKIRCGPPTPSRHKHTLESWYFEPSQPQSITSRLKTMFSLSPIYSARKSSNHNFFKNHQISPDTNLHKTKHKYFEELVPSVLPLLEKRIRLGHAGIVDHSVDLSIPDRSNKKF